VNIPEDGYMSMDMRKHLKIEFVSGEDISHWGKKRREEKK
jgi:hypothetical protein